MTPDKSNYLPHMIYELIKTGAPHSAILRFRKYWKSVNAVDAQSPCPLCFHKGVDAPLREFKLSLFRQRLRCAGCDHVFVIQPIST